MKITSEQLPASQVRFSVEVEGAQSQLIYDRMVKDLVRSVQVPGFRQGKAPKQLVLRQIGAENLKVSVMEKLIKDIFTQVTSEYDGPKIVGTPILNPDPDGLMEILNYGESISFTITADVEPLVVLQDYQNLSIQAVKIEPNQLRVDEILHEYRVKHATLIPVEDRGVKPDDEVTINSETILLEDGSLVEELSGEDIQLTMDESTIESQIFGTVLGMRIDETKESIITLPDIFPLEKIKLKQVKVKHTLIDIKQRELPPLDDEFAKSISSKETLEELQTFLFQEETKEAEDISQENVKQALIKALLERIQVDLPETLIEEQVDTMLRMKIQQFIDLLHGNTDLVKGILTPERVVEMRSQFREPAKDKVKESLALATIAKQENLNLNPIEVQTKIKEIRQAFAGKNIDHDRLREIVEMDVLEEMTIEWLRNRAQIEWVSESVEETIDVEAAEQSPAVLAAEKTIDVEAEDQSPGILEAEKASNVEENLEEGHPQE